MLDWKPVNQVRANYDQEKWKAVLPGFVKGSDYQPSTARNNQKNMLVRGEPVKDREELELLVLEPESTL